MVRFDENYFVFVAGTPAVAGTTVAGTTLAGTTVAGTTAAGTTVAGTTIAGTTTAGTTVGTPVTGGNIYLIAFEDYELIFKIEFECFSCKFII